LGWQVPRLEAKWSGGYVDRCTAGFSIDVQASLMLCAVLINAIWVKTCGTFQVCRTRTG
jgi:hypothetical protein